LTVYRDGSTAQDATGLTLTTDFAGRTGLNSVQIDLSTAGFYSSAGYYSVVVSSGAASTDASAQDISGYVITDFTVESLPNIVLHSIAGSSAAADTLREHVQAQTTGVTLTGSSREFIESDLSETTPDHYNGLVLKFNSGALAGQGVDIIDYSSTGKLTFGATLTETPSSGLPFVIA
jgi:hypothetical protein